MSVLVINGENFRLEDLRFEKEVVGRLGRFLPSDGDKEEGEEDGWDEEGSGGEGSGGGEGGGVGECIAWRGDAGGRRRKGPSNSRPPEEEDPGRSEEASSLLRKASAVPARRCKRRSSSSSSSGPQQVAAGEAGPHRATAHHHHHHHHHRGYQSPEHHHHHRPMEQEKRIRREIANSNERRRMQSINAGFQSLRTLLPHHEGEKLSKAAILQQTAEYIYQLEQEKTRLLSQNSQLKRLVNQHEGEASSAKKKKLEPGAALCASESSSADEGIGSMSPEPPEDAATNGPEMLRREMIDLRMQLDRERRLRMHLEDQVRSLEAQLYPERIREITQQTMMETHQEGGICIKQETSPLQTAASPPPGGLILLRPPTPTPPPPQQPSAILHLHPTSPMLSPHIPKVDEVVDEIVDDDTLRLSPDVVTRDCATPNLPPEPPALPSALESAIKAEPKVEVEMAPRLPSPALHTADAHEGDEAGLTQQSRLILGKTSRQNLETIVEAIRHLEGDHLFGDDPPHHHHHHLHHLHHHHHLQEVQMRPESPQEAPLALTTQVAQPPHSPPIQVEVHLGTPSQDYSPHLRHLPPPPPPVSRHPPPAPSEEEEDEGAVDLGCYRPASGATSVLALAPPNSHSSPSPPHHHHFEVLPMAMPRRHQTPTHAQQQHRPGVIVVKHT
ncbi:bromodomain-containing protein 4 isoform X2 [Ischnura elegans]|uniref:bromodomain-containing protein 4 isoform X2 n=1 Tax=Ischnura elegans TaxID=197161 RepID=UPI001ED88A1B|nr:bromodomain-containing protein 4 isoform X2 [Ischnura elegans]